MTNKDLAEETTNEGEPNNDSVDDSVDSVEMEATELRREEPPRVEPQESDPLQANVGDIKQWQAMDPTLARAREEAEDSESDALVGFYYQNELLYRKWRPEGSVQGDVRVCQ